MGGRCEVFFFFGVKFAREVGVYDFTLEGDSLVLFNALSGLSNPPAAVESVVKEGF